MLVAGEAGIGKTRLVEESAAWARERGYQVLTGGCVSLSANGAPFAPFVEALRPLGRDLAPADLDAVLGLNARDLAPLMPDVAPPREATGSTGISPDSGSGRLLELLLGMLGRLAARAPMLFVVEDIQWADRSTVDALAFLARNLRIEPVLLITTLRTDEPDSRRQLLPFIAELGRHDRAERIDLARLNRAEVAEQLSAILGIPAASGLIEGVYARSQGNAFFSEELLAAGAVAGALPQTLRDVLAARVGALSGEAQELVRLASAAGRRFPESLLARMADTDEPAVRGALREAIDQQILVRDQVAGGERISFRHALVQEVLYSDLLPSERVRLHAACAREIEARQLAMPEGALASELAYHWQAANEPERALPASIVAAMTSEAAGARSDAALQFERALQLLERLPGAEAGLPLDRVQLLEHAAANQLENPRRAVEHIRAAIELIDPARDPVRAGLLQAALGRYLWFSGDGAAALVACREAVRMVPRQPPSVERARVVAGLGQILMILAYSEEAMQYAEEAVQLAAVTSARTIESHALNTLGLLTAYLRDVDAGLAMLRRALEIATEVGSLDDIGRAYANLQDVLNMAVARYDESGDLGLEAVDPAAGPHVTGVWSSMVLIDVAWARYLGGRWDEALAALDRARLQPAGGVSEIEWEIRTAQVSVGRGEVEKAAGALDRLVQLLEGSADTQWIAPTASARAELAIWSGDPAGALRAVAEGLGRVQPSFGANVSRIGPMLALGVRAAADLAEHTRRPRAGTAVESARAEGADHLARMRGIRDEMAARWPAHLRLADPYLALCEAESSRLEGRSDPGAWAAAAELFQDQPQPYAVAYARYREGEAWLAARREGSRARSALRRAHGTALALGAAPLQAAIEAVARRGRVDLSDLAANRGRSSGPAGLTAREQEILGLVAGGLTNRQVGERLFITEKTASHHVSNILAKLGVGGRAEAAAEAVRLGITPPPE